METAERVNSVSHHESTLLSLFMATPMPLSCPISLMLTTKISSASSWCPRPGLGLVMVLSILLASVVTNYFNYSNYLNPLNSTFRYSYLVIFKYLSHFQNPNIFSIRYSVFVQILLFVTTLLLASLGLSLTLSISLLEVTLGLCQGTYLCSETGLELGWMRESLSTGSLMKLRLQPASLLSIMSLSFFLFIFAQPLRLINFRRNVILN